MIRISTIDDARGSETGCLGWEETMAAFEVADLSALEILYSRGLPTLSVTVRLADGPAARPGVTYGASTGSREAVERRDGDPGTSAGKGVLGAVGDVNPELA